MSEVILCDKGYQHLKNLDSVTLGDVQGDEGPADVRVDLASGSV